MYQIAFQKIHPPALFFILNYLSNPFLTGQNLQRDLSILIMSLISLLNAIDIVAPDRSTFYDFLHLLLMLLLILALSTHFWSTASMHSSSMDFH